MFTITKEWTFAAAHHLPSLPEGHQCHRVHGHNYRVTLVLQAERLDAHGMVVDYGDLAGFGFLLKTQVDHTDLNDLLPEPTAELLAVWLYHLALPIAPEVVAVVVRETDGTSAEYRP